MIPTLTILSSSLVLDQTRRVYALDARQVGGVRGVGGVKYQ